MVLLEPKGEDREGKMFLGRVLLLLKLAIRSTLVWLSAWLFSSTFLRGLNREWVGERVARIAMCWLLKPKWGYPLAVLELRHKNRERKALVSSRLIKIGEEKELQSEFGEWSEK